MWYKKITGRFFGLVTKHACDRQTDRRTDGWPDGQIYDFQDRTSKAVSHGNNNHLGTVSVHFTHASVFMIYNGSEFEVFHLY